MIRLNYILKSISVLNSLLIVAIAAVAYLIMLPASGLDIKLKSQDKDTIAALPGKPAVNEKLQAGDYALISDQNIFHPERKIPPEKKEEKAVPRPEVILYGTLITGQESIAFVEDKKAPRTTPGRGKRQTVLHKGERLSGYVLTEITANSIVLTKGEERIVVLLDEGEKRKESEASLLPSVSPMTPGGPQPTVPTSSKIAPATPSYPQAVVSPTPADAGNRPAARLPSRRNAAQMEVIKRMEKARQMQVP